MEAPFSVLLPEWVVMAWAWGQWLAATVSFVVVLPMLRLGDNTVTEARLLVAQLTTLLLLESVVMISFVFSPNFNFEASSASASTSIPKPPWRQPQLQRQNVLNISL